jgi:hypothetical protein
LYLSYEQLPFGVWIAEQKNLNQFDLFACPAVFDHLAADFCDGLGNAECFELCG